MSILSSIEIQPAVPLLHCSAELYQRLNSIAFASAGTVAAMKKSKRGAIVPDSNFLWTRGANYNWVCLIGNCSKSFNRKSHLVAHRGQFHKLSVHERNIPDQRRKKEGEIPVQNVFRFLVLYSTDSLWTHMISCYTDQVQKSQPAVDQSVYPRKGPRSIRRGDLVRKLILDGPKFIRRDSHCDKLSIDEILDMLFYGIQNTYFEHSTSIGFELLGQLMHRVHESRRLSEKSREARKRQKRQKNASLRSICEPRYLVTSIQFNVV